MVRRGERVTRRVVGLPAEVDGPLPAGARVGTLELRWRKRTIERDARSSRGRAIAAASISQRAGHFLSSTLLAIVLGGRRTR